MKVLYANTVIGQMLSLLFPVLGYFVSRGESGQTIYVRVWNVFVLA